MSEVHTVVPRTMCFVFFGDEILLMQGKDKGWGEIYDPLGGHIEKGEGVIASAEREIKEECGLTVRDTVLRGIVHVSNFFGKNVMLFVTSSVAESKEIRASEEGEPVWIHKDNLDKIKMFEDVKPILQHVLEMEKGKIFVGNSEFDGKDQLLALDIKIN